MTFWYCKGSVLNAPLLENESMHKSVENKEVAVTVIHMALIR